MSSVPVVDDVITGVVLCEGRRRLLEGYTHDDGLNPPTFDIHYRNRGVEFGSRLKRS